MGPTSTLNRRRASAATIPANSSVKTLVLAPGGAGGVAGRLTGRNQQLSAPDSALPTADLVLPAADLVASHMVMASRIARSFAGRGQETEDLTQVAMLELVNAAVRFDPARGIAFARYAYPCIVGGLKKHFRDCGWSLHVSRRMQEVHLRISRATPTLTQRLGRTPTVADLAAHLHLSEQDVRDGLHASQAYQTRSLSQPVNTAADQDGDLASLLGGPDQDLEAIPDRHALAEHVGSLPERQQVILRMRFFGQLTQREIGEALGVSQMHVSRLLAKSMHQLRESLLSRP